MLTKRQAEIVASINRFRNSGGRLRSHGPTPTQLGRSLMISRQSALYHLRRMQAAGIVTWEYGVNDLWHTLKVVEPVSQP